MAYFPNPLYNPDGSPPPPPDPHTHPRVHISHSINGLSKLNGESTDASSSDVETSVLLDNTKRSSNKLHTSASSPALASSVAVVSSAGYTAEYNSRSSSSSSFGHSCSCRCALLLGVPIIMILMVLMLHWNILSFTRQIEGPELPIPRSPFVSLRRVSPYRSSLISSQSTSSSSSSARSSSSTSPPFLASDGKYYTTEDYRDGFVWPHRHAKNTVRESDWNWMDPSRVIPAPQWLPYPPHLTPPKPRVDFVLRTFSGYSTLIMYLLRSMEFFIPFQSVGDVIIVLDDNDEDRMFAATLPDYVKVYHEAPPAYMNEWLTHSQSPNLGVNRKDKGYHVGLYSNWISDRYSTADYICVLDPDMTFITRGSLPLMFDWDEELNLYKPVWICRDHHEDMWMKTSYYIFANETWPHPTRRPGCMHQLPVCLHRSTLLATRLEMNRIFFQQHQRDYMSLKLDPKDDRDVDYLEYALRYWLARRPAAMQRNCTLNSTSRLCTQQVSSLFSINNVPPSPFDRTYMHMVNVYPVGAVCQFCVWGSYIVLHPEESRKYSFHMQGATPAGECPQPRVGTHTAYLVPPPKIGAPFYHISDIILTEGVCRASPPGSCNQAICDQLQWRYDVQTYSLPANLSIYPTPPATALSLTNFSGSAAPPPPFPFLPDYAVVLRQELFLKFEFAGRWWDENQKKRCVVFNMKLMHQIYEWIQLFDPVPQYRIERQCQSHSLSTV